MRSRIQSRRGRQRGIALILALVISALLAIIVIEFVYTTSVDLRQAKRFTDDSQVRLAVQSGLMFAEMLLRDDKLRGKELELDTLDDAWKTAEAPNSIGGLSIQLTITDEDSKFDLNNLTYPNADWRKVWRDAFVRLCEDLREHEGGENYEEIVDKIVEYMKGDKQFVADSETDVWSSSALLSLDDLLEVEGVTKEFLYGSPDEEDPGIARVPGLWQYLTIHSRGRINLNTADEPVLACLHEGLTDQMVQDILAHRGETDEESGHKKYYRTKVELKEIENIDEPLDSGDPSSSTVFKEIEKMVTCKSVMFMVTVDVSIDSDLTRHFRAYYKRHKEFLYRIILEEISPDRVTLPSGGVDADELPDGF